MEGYGEVLAMLSPEDRVWFEGALAVAGPKRGFRGVVLSLIEPWLRDIHSEHLEAYQRFERRQRSVAPFSFVPFRELLPRLACPVMLMHPEKSVLEAFEAVIVEVSERVSALPLFGALFRACDGSLHRFLEITAQSETMFYNHGSMGYTRAAEREALMHYEGHPAEALRLLLPGYYGGLFGAFGLERGAVDYEVLGPTRFDVSIRW